MEITFLGKSNSVQAQKVRDAATDPARNVQTEENSKYISKNKVDRAEISDSYSGSFDDKRISVAKSSILYDVSVKTSDEKIQELKAAIEKGEYKISTDVLADELLK